MNLLDILKQRGFIDNVTHEEELHNYLENKNITCYIGFDPTANSLHVGSLVPIMALAHMQKGNHKVLALVGGGTAMIGDPSGKTEMRKMLSLDEIDANAEGLKNQLSNYIDFKEDKAILLNNWEWLSNINYISFLRDIGKFFSVNRMIKAESYKMRLESEEGLSFIEFNYMLLQAYDFLKLFEKYECNLQMGGSDQWGNIVAGIDLVRRKHQKTVYGLTFPLITTNSGAKMGKTEKGAVWLDKEKTSPYDYYQFWVNTEDLDVIRFLKLFTFLPLAEIIEVKHLSDSKLNIVKNILAFEATLLAHGFNAAKEAHIAAMKMFGKRDIDSAFLPSSQIHNIGVAEEKDDIPHTTITHDEVIRGIPKFKLFYITGLSSSGSEARRLIKQGGAYINEDRIEDADEIIDINSFKNNGITLRAGKKRYHKLLIKN